MNTVVASPTGWRWLAFGAAVLGLCAVVLGAVGSHAIDLPNDAAQGAWDIALQIHYFQAAMLMALAAVEASVQQGRRVLIPAALLFTGTVVFCGSLYLRASGVMLLPGWLTPAGGMVLIMAWAGLCLILVRKN